MKKSFILWLVSFVGIISLLLFFFLPQKTPLTFQTIEQGKSTRAYKSTEPAIFVITKKDEDLKIFQD